MSVDNVSRKKRVRRKRKKRKRNRNRRNSRRVRWRRRSRKKSSSPRSPLRLSLQLPLKNGRIKRSPQRRKKLRKNRQGR